MAPQYPAYRVSALGPWLTHSRLGSLPKVVPDALRTTNPGAQSGAPVDAAVGDRDVAPGAYRDVFTASAETGRPAPARGPVNWWFGRVPRAALWCILRARMNTQTLQPGWLPPEWAPQSAVMLTWPHESADWWRWLDQVDRSFAGLAREIARRARVIVTVRDGAHEARVRTAISDAGADLARIEFFRAPADDAWVRDHGPITVLRDGSPVLLDFRFNGWGRKYDATEDDRLSGRLHALGAFGDWPLESVDVVLEGGSIETDGQGTLLTTASCLLSPQRNPGMSRADFESLFRIAFGVERVLWLEHGGLAGDDTDGHIDTLARFCDMRTIAWQACADRDDEHFEELAAMGEELAALRTLDGAPYRLVPLPLPAPKRDEDGKRLPASYANFLIVNGAVLVPAYDDPADTVAIERLRGAFPGHEVVQLDGLPIVHQYGSLHCVTMQLPEREDA